MAKDEKESIQVGKWQDRLSVSKKWRNQVAEQNNWEMYLEELKGKYDVVLGNNYVPPIGAIFAYRDSLVSNLYFRDPYIAINPRKEATIESAYILEAATNYYWQELKVKDEVELALSDTILIGHGWSKVGTNVRTSGSGDNLKLDKDSLYANRVSWRDMFMNVGCRKPTKDNLWIAQRIMRPTEEVKKEYPKLAGRITGSPYPSIDEKWLKTVTFKDDVKYTAQYEIWDAQDHMIYSTVDSVNDRYLTDPRPWPDYLEEFPFQFNSFHDIPDEPYPLSDVAPWEPQVREKIKLFTQMLNHIKRWNRQMLMKKGTMSLQEMDKFEKGFDGAILTASTSGDIQAAVKMLDFGQLPPDIYIALDRIDALIRNTNGLPEFMGGGVTKTSTRTEGELQMMKTGADSRSDRKLARIERFCENIARAMIAEMKNQFYVPVMAKITGKEPMEILKAFEAQGKFNPVTQTITFSAEDIKGEYDVKVKAGSTLPLDKMTRDKVLDQVLQIGAQISAQPSIQPFMVEVIKERLRDYDMPQLTKAFNEQNQAQQQQQQEAAANEDVNVEKTRAEAAKRTAQTKQIEVDTLIKGIQAAGKATGELAPEESLT